MIQPQGVTQPGSREGQNRLSCQGKQVKSFNTTSPHFALHRRNEYGNKDQDECVDWLVQFGHDIFSVLKETDSFVLDLGGAYKIRTACTFTLQL